MRRNRENRQNFLFAENDIAGNQITSSAGSLGLPALFYIGKEIQYIRRARFGLHPACLWLFHGWVSIATDSRQSYDGNSLSLALL